MMLPRPLLAAGFGASCSTGAGGLDCTGAGFGACTAWDELTAEMLTKYLLKSLIEVQPNTTVLASY